MSIISDIRTSQSETGYESGIMPDIAYFYDLVLQIKKAERNYLSNYYLDGSVWAEAIRRGEVMYQYRKDGYLNLWWEKEHFRRQYYFIADPCHYKVDADPMTIVCDVICRSSDLEETCRILSDAGMNQYAVYEKWMGKNIKFSKPCSREDLRVVDEDDGRIFIDRLYLYFDRLSDMLPEKRDVDQFIREKHFIGVHNECDDRPVAGIVYTKRGCVITEEFLFVTENYRGMGISGMLYNTLYQKYADEELRYVAWIRTNNLESTNIHYNYKYSRQDQFKVTFIK